MQSKTTQLNLLFDEWEQKVNDYNGKFVRDGIINEKFYLQAKFKILFITKEPNNPNQEAGDYCKWWAEALKYSFSNRIAEWSYGILNDFPDYDSIHTNSDSLSGAIKSIAFMNIKKSGGTGTSSYNMIMEHAKNNSDFIHRQIEIIVPNIIITGISWLDLRQMIFPNVKWEKSGHGIEIGRDKTAKIIDFYHPSSRTAPAAFYSLLRNVCLSEKFKSL